MDISKIRDEFEAHDDGDDMHYYYNRDERIRNAPKIVQDYYSGKFNPKGGIFKSLVSTTGNKMLLVCIVVCAAAVVYLYNTGDKPYRKHIAGAEAGIAAFSYEDEVYVSVTVKTNDSAAKSHSMQQAESGNDANGEGGEVISSDNIVEAAFTVLDADSENVGTSKITGALQDGEAVLRMKFQDYDARRVNAAVTYGGETKTLSVAIGGSQTK